MKLFGRKTLALLLALTMMLSLCSFTAFAEGETGTGTGATAVDSISLNKSSMTLEEGKSETLEVTFSPEGSSGNVTWDSSDKTVATVAGGSVAAVKAGEAIITANCNGKTAQCTVTVTAKPVEVQDISITTKKDMMVVGEKFKFVATLDPTNATIQTITWSANPSDVAAVSADGEVTAIKAGTATIMAKGGSDAAPKTDSVTVTVVENNIVAVNTNTQSKTLDYGKTLDQVKAELAKIEWSVKYGNETTQVAGTAKLPASAWTSSAFEKEKAGTFAFTASFGTGLDVTVNVTINKGQVKENKVITYETYKGVGKDTVITKLPSKVAVNLTSGGTYTFDFGSNGDFQWVCNNYDPNKVATYTFTAVANNNQLATAHFANIDMNGKTITAQVTVSPNYPLPISETLYYNRNTSTSINLESTVRDAVNAAIKTRLGVTTPSVAYKKMVTLSCDKNTYGKLGTGTYAYTYTADSSKFTTSRTMQETFSYSALDTDGVTYSGTITLTITSSTFDVSDATSTSDPIVYFSGSNGIASKIADAFKARYGSTPTYIEFGSIGRNDDKLGELRDGNGDSVEDGTYTFSSKDEDYDSVANIYFVPTGVDGTFEIEYTAYSGSSKRSDSMTGTISIKCAEMLVVWLSDMGAGETRNLSASAIQEQVTEILDTNRISYTLDTVSLNRPSAGTIYDGSNKKITTKTVDAEDLDDYTYEAPAKVPSANLVTIRFSVKCKPDSGKSSKSASGVMLFNLIKKADITISASANGYATLDVQDFINFLQDKKGSNTTLKYVTFNGLPNSKTNGYMYDGYSTSYYSKQDRISSPDNGKYYDDDAYPSNSKKNDYKLEDLTWVVGKTNKVSAEFTIRYTSGSSKTEKSLTGTIDFVIDGGSVSGNTKKVDLDASKTYSNFYYDLINSNVASVRFVSVTGGKLIYRDVSSQTPITPGTDVYYLSSTGYLAGRRMLSNVVFLPGYNQTSATITLKAFDAKGKSANAQYIFTIKPVTTSSFSDMSNYSSYAGSVGLMTNLGIINGVGNNKFNPTGTVTRGEWITMLYRAAGSPAVYSSVSFTDVPSWCKDAVQWAVQNGITDGIGNNKFGPDMTLDRMQIVTFMYRFAKLQGMDVSSTLYLSAYTDGNTVDTWAQPAMKWALQKGYLDPVGGKIQPKGTMTRVMVADCLARLLTK